MKLIASKAIAGEIDQVEGFLTFYDQNQADEKIGEYDKAVLQICKTLDKAADKAQKEIDKIREQPQQPTYL